MKKLFAALVVLSMCPLAAFAQPSASTAEAVKQFLRDQAVIAPGGNGASAISKVQEAGLMSPYTDGRFHPERALTRAELATVLVKAFHLGERKVIDAETAPLKDVPSGYWAANDINLVTKLGVMHGYRDGYFYPEQRTTRAEALAILAQAYGVYQYDDQTVDAILSNYPDARQIPAWARKSLATSLKYGFVDVAPKSKIRPLQPMTRGDMAFALSQYLERVKEAAEPNLH